MPFAIACMVSAALCSVTLFGSPDLLKHGPKSTRELARTRAAHEDGVYRFRWKRVRRTKSPVCVLEAEEANRERARYGATARDGSSILALV
jgi:hypothetical protein